jgi:hypothetical protein
MSRTVRVSVISNINIIEQIESVSLPKWGSFMNSRDTIINIKIFIIYN